MDKSDDGRYEGMRAVILAGGLGTRIAEESHLRPKPMIEVGGRPILWHIMKIYSAQGVRDFVVCAGYKQHVIKEYFDDYFLHSSDVTFDYRGGEKSVELHGTSAEPWRVTVADTGYATQTGGRVRRARRYVGDRPFLLTYGDGVADVDLGALVACHRSHPEAVVTVTGVSVAQSKGVLSVDADGTVRDFREKRGEDGSVINGGFMVCEPELFDLLGEGCDGVPLEEGPLSSLAEAGRMACYRHPGFWRCMDTQRERDQLEAVWASGDAPWKVW